MTYCCIINFNCWHLTQWESFGYRKKKTSIIFHISIITFLLSGFQKLQRRFQGIIFLYRPRIVEKDPFQPKIIFWMNKQKTQVVLASLVIEFESNFIELVLVKILSFLMIEARFDRYLNTS